MSEPTAVKRTRHFTPAVFWPSVALILVFVLLAAAEPEGTNSVIANISSVVVKNAGWCYILAVAGFVVFALVVAVSRKGDTVLGPDDAEPEYSRGSWFAMLFAAGMGIGLVFWGAAEPLQHYNFPRPGSGVKAPGSTPSPDAARDAMNTTFLHWGLHAWAVYVVVGLAIAYAVMWTQNGLPALWALVASTFLYAGAMQFLLAGLLATGTSLGAVALATLAVNLRLIFYGFSFPTAAYRGRPLLLAYSIFALTDEAYSLIAPMGRDTDPRLIARIEALCQLYWIGGTALGLLLGQIIPPTLTGFEFALTALFIILAQSHSYYRERRPAQAYGLIAILIALATVSDRNVLAAAIAILLALLCLTPRKTIA